MMDQLRVLALAVKAAVILHLRAAKTTDAPDRETLPVDAARKALERCLRQLADVPVIVVGFFDRLNQT